LRKFILLAACLAWGARGQEEPTFSTDVKVVNLLATVTNKKKEIIRDLNKDDFSVAEDGRPQTIRYFARDSDLPLTLGLMVDTSMSQRRVMDAERSASRRFLDQVVRESKDQVFIMQFDMAVFMRQVLTSSLQKLDESLGLVDTPTMDELQHQFGGGTLLYDAVLQASKDVMKGRSGRKALIVMSDGVDTGSEHSLASAIEAAQRADTLVYSILFSDATAYGFSLGDHDGRKVLMRLSKETGAGFFEVSKKQSIEQIFDVIQEELRSQYSLGYVSDQPVRISEFRKIRLAVKQKDLVVQVRDRYWAQR
jgi:VWFA-related protein